LDALDGRTIRRNFWNASDNRLAHIVRLDRQMEHPTSYDTKNHAPVMFGNEHVEEELLGVCASRQKAMAIMSDHEAIQAKHGATVAPRRTMDANDEPTE